MCLVTQLPQLKNNNTYTFFKVLCSRKVELTSSNSLPKSLLILEDH